jgi:hypothetical protein
MRRRKFATANDRSLSFVKINESLWSDRADLQVTSLDPLVSPNSDVSKEVTRAAGPNSLVFKQDIMKRWIQEEPRNGPYNAIKWIRGTDVRPLKGALRAGSSLNMETEDACDIESLYMVSKVSSS